MDDLPSPNTRRWVARRKATVVAAVWGGLITLDEACRRYTLSIEEYLSWERAIKRHGLPGLRVTRLQDYRAEPIQAGRPTIGLTGDLSRLSTEGGNFFLTNRKKLPPC